MHPPHGISPRLYSQLPPPNHLHVLSTPLTIIIPPNSLNYNYYHLLYSLLPPPSSSPSSSPSPSHLFPMLCFQSLHFSLLGKWVQAFRLQLRGIRRRRKAKQLFSGLPTPFGAMEFSNQLKHVFKLIDANSDGKISSLELKEVLMCLGEDKSKAAKEAEVMVKEVDCNGDGFIDMEEFMGVVGGKSEGSREELMDAFLIFDRDRNGFISAEELRRVLVSLGYGKCTLKECFLMIRGVDMNGDGLIDFEEFRLMMTRCGE